MSARGRRLLWILLVMALTASAAVLLRPLRRETPFHRPGEAEFARLRQSFTAMLAGNEGPLATDLGLQAMPMAEPQGMMLSEPAGTCGGRGVYLLRGAGDWRPVAIVAPHRGADRDTGPIAAQLFSEAPFVAAAWNSAPRRGDESCPAGGDPASVLRHPLTAFSLAFAERYPGGRIVQIHGFDAERRETEAARRADAIVSDGSAQPSARLLDLADCLSRAFPDRAIAVYPVDTRELGATRNAQGKALRAAGFAGFAHLEFSAPLRSALVSDPALRARLARCLETGL